jgi:hypothetical protein
MESTASNEPARSPMLLALVDDSSWPRRAGDMHAPLLSFAIKRNRMTAPHDRGRRESTQRSPWRFSGRLPAVHWKRPFRRAPRENGRPATAVIRGDRRGEAEQPLHGARSLSRSRPTGNCRALQYSARKRPLKICGEQLAAARLQDALLSGVRRRSEYRVVRRLMGARRTRCV